MGWKHLTSPALFILSGFIAPSAGKCFGKNLSPQPGSASWIGDTGWLGAIRTGPITDRTADGLVGDHGDEPGTRA